MRNSESLFDLSLIRDGMCSIVRVAGEIDGAAAGPLSRLLSIATIVTPVVRVDLAGVRFIDSSGLTPIIEGARRDGIQICAVSDRVRRVLELLGVSWHPSVDVSAWDRCGSGPSLPVGA